MKKLRDLISEVRLPTAKGELDFYKKAGFADPEITDDPDNAKNPDNPLKKLPKPYTGLDPKGGKVTEETIDEALDPKDARRGKMPNHHPVEGVKPETPIKEEVELLSEDEMARRAYVYERIFTLIDDITSIVDEFYTEEKDYENAINARNKEYRKNPDKDPKIPYPEYPTRPWSIASVASTLDQIYQDLLGNTNRDIEHVYEEVSLTEISKELVSRYRGVAKGDRDYNKANKAHADHNHDKADTGPGAKAHYKKVSDASAEKIKKREKGIAAATKRIGEEVEQIDELSKNKLSGYISKNDDHHHTDGSNVEKRNKYHSLALKKLGSAAGKVKVKATNEEVKQIDELSSETKNSYVQKALADKTLADKEARMNISGAKKVGVADPKEGRRLLAIAKQAAARRDKRSTGISRAKKDDA